MNKEWLVSPEYFFHSNIKLGNLLNNKNFINPLLQYVSYLREFQFWDTEKIQRIQLLRLKKLLQYLEANSTFWSEYLKHASLNSLKSINDLDKLPILNRKKLIAYRRAIYIKNKSASGIITLNTSGTTGTPKKIFIKEKEAIIAWYACRLSSHAFNFSDEFLKRLFKRKFAICLGGTGRVWLADFMHLLPTTPESLIKKNNRKAIYGEIRKAKPVILIGPASLIYKLSEYMIRDKFDTSSLLALELTSEPISEDEENFIKKNLSTPVLNTFSCAEAGPIGFECPENPGKFHLHSHRVILEVIGHDGTPLKSGREGDLAITALDRKVTPIIRFITGDRGKIISKSCPCGRTLPLFKFSGRRGDELILPSGKRIRSVFLYSSLKKIHIGARVHSFQIRQITRSRITIFLVPHKKSKKGLKFEKEIKSTLRQLFGGEKEKIEIRYVKILPRSSNGKTLFFIPLKTKVS